MLVSDFDIRASDFANQGIRKTGRKWGDILLSFLGNLRFHIVSAKGRGRPLGARESEEELKNGVVPRKRVRLMFDRISFQSCRAAAPISELSPHRLRFVANNISSSLSKSGTAREEEVAGKA